jgi:hypothetical protein
MGFDFPELIEASGSEINQKEKVSEVKAASRVKLIKGCSILRGKTLLSTMILFLFEARRAF